MKERKFPSKERFIATVAFMWATPMGIFFGWLFWKFNALSIEAAFAIICICAAAGWGIGALVYQLTKSKMKSGGKQH